MMDVEDMIFLGLDLYGGLTSLATEFELGTPTVISVEALRPDDPRSCQMDARFQPRSSSGSVIPAKGVRTGCPDTSSDGFFSHGLER